LAAGAARAGLERADGRRHDLGHRAGGDAPVPRLAAALGPSDHRSPERWSDMARLDPQARSLLEAMQAAGLPQLFTLPVADARRRQLVVAPARVGMVKVETIVSPGRWTPSRWLVPAEPRKADWR